MECFLSEKIFTASSACVIKQYFSLSVATALAYSIWHRSREINAKGKYDTGTTSAQFKGSENVEPRVYNTPRNEAILSIYCQSYNKLRFLFFCIEAYA
jgi:hypothetical protein